MQNVPNQAVQQLMNNPAISQAKSMINMLKNAGNPQALMKNMISQNPQMKQAMDYVNANGGNAKEAFYKLAQERGMNPEEIMKALK